MDFEDFGAMRRNADDCERIAEQIRSILGLDQVERAPPVMELFAKAREALPEARNLDVLVREDSGVADGTAIAHPDTCEIHVGMDFVDGAIADRSDIRFIAAHELMHILFHRGAPRYFKKPGGNVLVPFIRDQHESAEWQADRLARALLMPKAMTKSNVNAFDLARAAGVPLVEAQKRIEELAPVQSRQTPHDVARILSALKRETARGSGADRNAAADLLKQELWDDLPMVPGEDPAIARMCGKYQIWWSDFGKTTGCGWYIEGGSIKSFFPPR